MDTKLSNGRDYYMFYAESESQRRSYFQEIYRKNNTIRFLCSDIVGHIEANIKLATENELLLRKSREATNERKNLLEEIANLRADVATLKKNNLKGKPVKKPKLGKRKDAGKPKAMTTKQPKLHCPKCNRWHNSVSCRLECYYCGKPGHVARVCHSKKKDNAKKGKEGR